MSYKPERKETHDFQRSNSRIMNDFSTQTMKQRNRKDKYSVIPNKYCLCNNGNNVFCNLKYMQNQNT